MEDVVQESVDVEVCNTVERDHDDKADTVVVSSPQQAALPGHGGEEGDVMALAEHCDTIEGGEQREGDGLQVSILASEQRAAPTDGEAQEVGRHVSRIASQMMKKKFPFHREMFVYI